MWRGPSLLTMNRWSVARLAGNVDILAQLDIAFGAQDGQAPVAPGGQAFRGEPVDADIARSVGRAHMRIAHILQARLFGMAAIGDAGRYDLGVHRIGEEQELLELVAGDIAEDAAIALRG